MAAARIAAGKDGIKPPLRLGSGRRRLVDAGPLCRRRRETACLCPGFGLGSAFKPPYPFSYFRRTAVGFAALALSLSAGCAATRPTLSEMRGLQSDIGAVVMFDGASRPNCALPGAKTRDRSLDVLVLSGGGADGAFGAGVLMGGSATGERPIFDIVTGLSTGALLATFAFLGSRYDAQLKASYTELKGSDIYDGNGVLAAFTDSALLDNAPLRRTLAKVVDEDVIDAVGVQHRAGRRLYVATTNLDRGELLVWDMGAIAASPDPARYEVYREIVRASTAVPGIFTPVFLKVFTAKTPEIQMHVDGGIKAPLLLRDFMLRGDQQRKSVFVIADAQLALRLPPSQVPARYIVISARHQRIIPRSVVSDVVSSLCQHATRQGRTSPGIDPGRRRGDKGRAAIRCDRNGRAV